MDKEEKTIVRDGVRFTEDMKTLVKYPPDRRNTAYTIPPSVTSIGSSAFEDCENLTEIVLP
ncbi:MAG: leucine-rich repeat domain-containing protein, partial [Gracilibacteraceae bacterium]|nr:leucine-rich repeat domain-containing protein [Gracilibacteraceae bacterium]